MIVFLFDPLCIHYVLQRDIFSWVFGFFGGEKNFFVYLQGGWFLSDWRKVLWGCE